MRAPLTAIAGLAALAALSSGCGDPRRADVQVFWTFAGQTCQQAGVDVVQVDIANELLTPNRFFCTDPTDGSLRVGVDLGAFLLGTYDLTLTGFDAGGAILYRSSRQFTVQGDTELHVDLQPAAAGTISLNWTFGGLTCAQAGVTSVRMSVDGGLITDQSGSVDVACSAGGIDGTSISPLAPGTHRIDLVGVRGAQPSYWLPNRQVNVVSGASTSVLVDLPVVQPTFATADVSWDALASGGGFALGSLGAMTCAEAQVDVVQIALDPNLDGTGGIFAGEVACNTNDVEGAQVSPIPAGTHTFAISGIRGSTVVYQTLHPASARFEVGLLSNVDVDADPVGSGLGSATLSWDFGTASPVCPVTYTLTEPSGTQRPAVNLPCGSPTTVTVPNDFSGLWGIDAKAGAFQAHILFAVPNQTTASWIIPFSK